MKKSELKEIIKETLKEQNSIKDKWIQIMVPKIIDLYIGDLIEYEGYTEETVLNWIEELKKDESSISNLFQGDDETRWDKAEIKIIDKPDNID